VRPPRPLPPVPHPAPYPYPERPGYPDLGGYCSDFNEWGAARDFAYTSSGLNYNSSGAEQWAHQYVNSHACGTIYEFSMRFRELYNYGYSSTYMNLNSSGARDFALPRAEYMRLEQIQYWKRIFVQVKDFAYSSSYLNFNSSRSVQAAREWNERGYCGDEQMIERMKSDFRYYYDYAYSSRGLNYSSSQARSYALNQIANHTNCIDLFY